MESPSISRVRPPQPYRIRSPLSISTNSSPPLPTYSSEHPLSPGRRIRRIASLSYNKMDSSEEVPSSNGSGIYNAHSYSKSNSADSSGKPENIYSTAVDGQPSLETLESYPTLLSLDNIGTTPIMYGYGTRLDTIVEKNSNSTMQTLTHSKSTGAISSIPSRSLLAHKDSLEISRMQRQRSFSMDDMTTISAYHEACSSVAEVYSNGSQLRIDDIAQPKKPLLAPPSRPLTPPGMPSWTALQQRSVPPRISSNTRERIASWWGGQPTISSRIPTATDPGRRISLPPGVTSVPRYRPPRSGYTSIDSHPFNRLPAPRPVKTSVPKPNLGGILVTKTWSVVVEEATLPVGEQHQPPSEYNPPSNTRLFRSVRGASVASASALSYAHNLNRMNAGGYSVCECTATPAVAKAASIKKPPCDHGRYSLSSFTHASGAQPSSPINNSNENRPFSLNRLDNISENHPTTSDVTSGPNQARSKATPQSSLAIPGDGQSTVIMPVSPTHSQEYLIPVTNLEKPKRRDLCFRCYVGSYLHDLGIWIDRHGEKFEKFVDRAGKKMSLMCCGFTAGEQGEGFRGVGANGGNEGEQMEGPRQVSL